MLNEILSSCKFVMDNAGHVKINYKNLDLFIQDIDCNDLKHWLCKSDQLLVSNILHLRESQEKIVVDYTHLLGCADYKIPQTMRAWNIIEYDKVLSLLVDAKKELELSSKYEVEIRASMIVVIDYIKNKLENISAIDINDYFFVSSKKVKDKAKPYHLCRNTNY